MANIGKDVDMEKSTHTERIAALIGEARKLDEQVAEVAERIHLVQADIELEVNRMPGDTDAVDLFPFYERSGSEELRTVATAMAQRLEAAVDEVHPGNHLDEVQRRQFDRYGLGGFGIDPSDKGVRARQSIDAGAGTSDEPMFAVLCTCRWIDNTTDLVDAMKALAEHRDTHGLEPWANDEYIIYTGTAAPDLDQETIDAALAEAKAAA